MRPGAPLSEKLVPEREAVSFSLSDIPAIKELLLRISSLIEDIPEIQEMDLNPIMAMGTGQGCYVADARISVMPVSE